MRASDSRWRTCKIGYLLSAAVGFALAWMMVSTVGQDDRTVADDAVGFVRIDITPSFVTGDEPTAEAVALQLRRFVQRLYASAPAFSQDIMEVTSHAVMLSRVHADAADAQQYADAEAASLCQLIDWHARGADDRQFDEQLRQMRSIYPTREIAESRLESIEHVSPVLVLYGDLAKLSRDAHAADIAVQGRERLRTGLLDMGRDFALAPASGPYDAASTSAYRSTDAFICSLIESGYIVLHDDALRRGVLDYLR